MGGTILYQRDQAVRYAHRWAYERNPRYYNYDEIGGDCTNFASQCLYAGAGIMNQNPTFGWFYHDANRKAPAWTGVSYFYNFLVRTEENSGPFGQRTLSDAVLPGDFVQIGSSEQEYRHTLIIVETGRIPTPENILIAAHSRDADYRPLSAYDVQSLRFIHITGVRLA